MGCNLWSGCEEDCYKVICQFCDIDFWGMDGLNGGCYIVEELVDQVMSFWLGGGKFYVVCMGGEFLL